MRENYEFKTVDEYLHAVETRKKYSHSGETRSYDFTLTDSLSEAIDLARRGWLDGAEAIRKFQGTLTDNVSTQSVERGVWRKTRTGGAVRVPAYVQGRPDCFLQYKKQRETKFVTLVYTGSTSGGVSNDVMIQRGAITGAAIDLLESRNIRVKLVLAYATEKNGVETNLYVTLKEHHESLDLDRVAFWLAHPSALRRVKFAFYDTVENGTIRSIGTGSGAPKHPDFQGDIYVPRALNSDDIWSNVRSTLTYIRELLAAKGIEL